MASTNRRPRLFRRRTVILYVLGLLLVPVLFGVVLGWYGLDPPQAERLAPVGSEAQQLLNGFPDDRLVVEIAAPPGEGPTGASVGLLWMRMNETLSKMSISFEVETIHSTATSFTTDDLWNLEAATRTTWPGPGQMSLFYLFVPGSYAGDSSVIGLAYFGSSIAVFPATIAAAGGSAAVTSTVMIHEFGHELGLVGIVGSAPNEDPAHPYHSADPNDVMYWAVDTTAILSGLLGGGPPTQFGSADLQDLSTVRSTVIVLEVLPWVVLAAVFGAALAVVVYHRRAHRRGSPPLPSTSK
ncbi:MAG: immune inhibitor A [Thermoplasmata archaeon]|nr:immune inhibitor A [Thermoplasmata archaeon]